jgi:hypothetical protein
MTINREEFEEARERLRAGKYFCNGYRYGLRIGMNAMMTVLKKESEAKE